MKKQDLYPKSVPDWDEEANGPLGDGWIERGSPEWHNEVEVAHNELLDRISALKQGHSDLANEVARYLESLDSRISALERRLPVAAIDVRAY